MVTTTYTPELTEKLLQLYYAKTPTSEIAEQLGTTERSVIAKLSSLKVYERKTYRNKNGEIPIKKAEYIDKLAILLDVPIDRLESLEKVNKSVLKLLEDALTDKSEAHKE